MGIAEIADKLIPVPQVWLWALILSLPLLWAAARVRGKASSLIVLCLAGSLTALLSFVAMNEAFLDRDLTTFKVGTSSRWVAHAITAAFLPLVVVAMILGLRRSKRGPR